MREIKKISTHIRQSVLKMHTRAGESHIGSALSVVDILAVLYFKVLKIFPGKPRDEKRDILILSKGHAASALYAALAARGILKKSALDSYCKNGGRLCGHSDDANLPGIEIPTGSLGHGLSVACGMAKAFKNDKKRNRIFVVMGDGECGEGSVWEAALFASHHKLDNITVIVDRNRLQGLGRTEEVLRLEPFIKKWAAFGWQVEEVNGHEHKEIEDACRKAPYEIGFPSVIIANTIKGRGISFMEDKLEWHYKSPTMEEYEKAMIELR